MIDRHHVLFNAREWEARPQFKELRRDSGLIVPMDREVHNELHKSVPFVPTIGYVATMAVLKDYYRGRTHGESVENLMFSIEGTKNHDRMSDIEKALCDIALDSLDIQREFITN